MCGKFWACFAVGSATMVSHKLVDAPGAGALDGPLAGEIGERLPLDIALANVLTVGFGP